MSTQHPNGYSVRDIILRYESEEEEFVRELEQMMEQSQENENDMVQEPDEGPPILSVLCSLVDEIGSLRTENRRLKTRLVPAPRNSKNVVQRMSAMFEQRGSSIFPKLRRSNRSSDSMEIRNGARERLSTPPRKENSNSMTTSTDVSYGRSGAPPIVRPELSDSEIDDQVFDEDDHRSRDTTRRCDSVNVPRHQNDHSTSACTSPSSASSSRDPSETMITSRSSFLDLLGLRRRSTHIPQPTSYSKTTSLKQVIKKRRRKISGNGNDSESSGMYVNMEDHCSRVANKPPRPASYYRRDDSEDSDCLRQIRQRKTASTLNVNNYKHEDMYRVSKETHWQHEKDNLMAEIEEMKMRNLRLVEQLREKSQQQSKLQCQLHKVEMQVNTLSRKCALSEALDRLTLDERMEKSATVWIKKIEERLRIFENQMQNAKLEAATAHQMALNSSCHEKDAHQNCLEKLENLQREHMRVIHSSLMEIGVDEMNMKRRLENLPTYEALYAFTHSVVRRLNEARWAMIEKANEASRAQIDLIVSQSSHLVSLAQLERLKIMQTLRGKRQKRPSSFHGHSSTDRNVRQNLSFYLPLKLHGSRVENSRRTVKKNSIVGSDRNIEEEFLKLFSYSKDVSIELAANSGVPERRATNRIETMIREMNGNNRPTVRRGPSGISNSNLMRDRVTREVPSNRRPISLVETEERRIRRNEETRRSIKFMKTNSIDHGYNAYEPPQRFMNTTTVTASQDVSNNVHSPHNTPVFTRKIIIPVRGNAYDIVPEGTTANIVPASIPQMGRVRKLERAFSAESRNTVDSLHDREERRERREHGEGVERRQSKIQRSQPVSRLKQPSAQLSRFRTVENGGVNREPPTSSILRNRALDPPTSIPRMTTSPPDSRIPTPSGRHGGEKRGWLERLKGIGKL
ncbi:hypothetical protein L3Y34_004358 [Caenorhabditis briggsae]|uniref:Uncharacterized protein n=1 Tax=Caenorhabditis briggsae TaxID=6238 RepID=A0AAE9AF27_CAEBR|nr:hypothetical protein L3Y34_004358 [Caenorhabditis briggsae]